MAMTRSVKCPFCHYNQPVEDSADKAQLPVVCHNCGQVLPEKPAATTAAQPATILWIDDDPLLLAFGKSVLEPHGYQVLTASDGPSGIAVATREEPDLIIVDVLMPTMDGYEVCRQLRAQPGLKDTPVILLTVLEGPEVGVLGRGAGAVLTLSKRNPPERILSVIEATLRRRRDQPTF